MKFEAGHLHASISLTYIDKINPNIKMKAFWLFFAGLFVISLFGFNVLIKNIPLEAKKIKIFLEFYTGKNLFDFLKMLYSNCSLKMV